MLLSPGVEREGVITCRYFDPEVFVPGRVYDVCDNHEFIPMILHSRSDEELVFEYPGTRTLSVKTITLDQYLRKGNRIVKITFHKL
jgi:hypothetical protein